MKRVLITGGAGFIGSHRADELLAHGYHVRALDNLTEQVHGKGQNRPDHLADAVELVVGSTEEPDAVRHAE